MKHIMLGNLIAFAFLTLVPVNFAVANDDLGAKEETVVLVSCTLISGVEKGLEFHTTDRPVIRVEQGKVSKRLTCGLYVSGDFGGDAKVFDEPCNEIEPLSYSSQRLTLVLDQASRSTEWVGPMLYKYIKGKGSIQGSDEFTAGSYRASCSEGKEYHPERPRPSSL